MKKHFCTCTVTTCAKHPGNHSDGCDPCMESNLRQKKVPACMFKAVYDDLSGVTDYTFRGFADFLQLHGSEPAECD